jgi:hypothetical protein
MLHEVEIGKEDFHDTNQSVPESTTCAPIEVNKVGKSDTSRYPSSDIRAILSQKSSGKARQVNMVSTTSTSSSQVKSTMVLVDRGANGGIAGNDVRVLVTTDRAVDVQGIDNHRVTNLPIGTVAGLFQTNIGAIVLIMYQHVLIGRGQSIDSPVQWEWCKHNVCDKSIHVGGKMFKPFPFDR